MEEPENKEVLETFYAEINVYSLGYFRLPQEAQKIIEPALIRTVQYILHKYGKNPPR
jgi:hypothetical protein